MTNKGERHVKKGICVLIMKTNEMHYFSTLFDKVLYIFRIDPLFIIKSIPAMYTRNKYLSFHFCWHLLAWF